MPKEGDWRNNVLYSSSEIATAWGKSERTVRRLVEVKGIYFEKEESERGGRGSLYFDPATIIAHWGEPQTPLISATSTDISLPSPTVAMPLPTTPIEEGGATELERRIIPDLRQAKPEDIQLWERLEQLRREIAGAPRGSKVGLVAAFAQAEETTPTTVYRWLATKPEEFFKARRADAGASQIPAPLLEATTSLWLHHPNASAWTIHRWLEVGSPDILIYRHGAYERRFSVRGVRDIRARLEADPITRVAMLDEDGRKEFIRTWSGAVLATHPNELWQMDMTRCDTFVFGYARPGDTAPSAFRLRLHDCIDHFTGAIPALVFSREESRRPTTRLLILGLFPKPGWNIHGRPRRIYHDNGSAYIAESTQRGLATLGIETSTSQAWVSHTRGKVENFHKLFHAWERALPGYAGEDASQRNDWELSRRTQNTQRWFEKGCTLETDPGRENRLLLEDEYKAEALNWLNNDYHARILSNGLTRAEAFTRFVPRETQVAYNLRDLFEIFADSDTRTVTANGEVRWRNTRYTLLDGSLMVYQNREVVVTEYEHPLTGEPIVSIYLQQPNGTLAELGTALPAPDDALSAAAFAQRKANKVAVRELFAQAEQYRQNYLNPAWRQDAVLSKGEPSPTQPLELRGPKAELTRESPAQIAARERAVRIQKAEGDPLAQAILTLFNPTGSAPTEPEEN
jgi:putative transposase